MAALSRKKHPRILRSGQSALGCGSRSFDVAFICPLSTTLKKQKGKQKGQDWVRHVINVSAGWKAGTEAVRRSVKWQIATACIMKGVCQFGQNDAYVQESCWKMLMRHRSQISYWKRYEGLTSSSTQDLTYVTVFFIWSITAVWISITYEWKWVAGSWSIYTFKFSLSACVSRTYFDGFEERFER